VEYQYPLVSDRRERHPGLKMLISVGATTHSNENEPTYAPQKQIIDKKQIDNFKIVNRQK